MATTSHTLSFSLSLSHTQYSFSFSLWNVVKADKGRAEKRPIQETEEYRCEENEQSAFQKYTSCLHQNLTDEPF